MDQDASRAENTGTNPTETRDSPSGRRTPPERVGQYHIKRVIATGGMGTVYEAAQEHPRRTVAVKVMKPGVTSRSALRRFEYEAQVLARLRHPGIAQVYDAGTHRDETGEVPFFAMEYIPNAQSITRYASEKKLGTRERLVLFTQVCDAIHHGHQKGIIHRDLKPSNLLVDSSGQVKIIDFGVARSTDSDMAVTALQTAVGELVGTLRYMSPEQCAGDPQDIDTRSDVYSLGVVLYELLTGTFPYDLEHTPLWDAPRVIREEPAAPPRTVDKSLGGDLGTIILKPLEKDRARRYQSASALAEDIERFLGNEPISARPPSAIYQFRKFVRRRRLPLATCVVLLLALGFALDRQIRASWSASLVRTRDAAYAVFYAAQPDSILRMPQRIIHDCTRAIALDPTLALAYALRAKAYMLTGDEQAAWRDCSQALTLDPDNALAQRTMAYLHVKRGEFAQALDLYERGLQPYILNTDFPRDLNNRARLRAIAGDYKGSIEDYDRAVALVPRTDFVRIGRANARRYAGDIDGAIADLGTAMDLAPRRWGLQCCLWIWELRMLRGAPGDREAAESALDAGQGLAATALERLAVGMYRGEVPADVLATARKTPPEACGVFYCLGAKALVDENVDEARRFFELSVAAGVDNTPEYDLARWQLKRIAGR